MIAYLGDSDENGGTQKNPLEPHIHLGIRAGQRADYPGKGEWRWQAGWIKPCPSDLGWLQPSFIIASQKIPVGGFSEPNANFLAKWGIELLFGGFYMIGGICMLIFATRKNKPILLLFAGVILLAATWFFYHDGWRMSYALLPLALLLLAIGIYQKIWGSKKSSENPG